VQNNINIFTNYIYIDMKTYNLYIETVDHFSNILTIDVLPDGPLSSLVFLHTSSKSTMAPPTYIICHPLYSRSVVKEGEVTVIFDYLKANGYKIESDITQYYPSELLDFFGLREDSIIPFDQCQKNNTSVKQFICRISFNI